MAKLVQKYESLGGRLFDSLEEAKDDDFKHKVSMVCSSVDTDGMGDGADITLDVLLGIKAQFGKLTKLDLQKMIDIIDTEK